MIKNWLLAALLIMAYETPAQQYFETVIPGTSHGWTTWEYPLDIVFADDEKIRLRIHYHADAAGPNPSNPGFVDYNIGSGTISPKIFWNDGLYGGHFPQFFYLSEKNTLIIQSGFSNSRMYNYSFHQIIDVDHHIGRTSYWNPKKTIAAINVQKYKGEYYGLYTIDDIGYNHNDTVFLAKLNLEKENITLLEQYVLPFEPHNAGTFFFRPEENEFDFVFENYKVTFDLGQTQPTAIDSNFTRYLSNQGSMTAAGSRAKALMNGRREWRITPAGDFAFVFKDSLEDSIVYKLFRPSLAANSAIYWNAFNQDADSNLLVLTSVADTVTQELLERTIWRINQSDEVVEKIPVTLFNDSAQIYLIKEDARGNFILAGTIYNDEIEYGLKNEIYLARITSQGQLIRNFQSSEVALLVPNPAQTTVQIITKKVNEEIYYTVFNENGAVVQEGKTLSHKLFSIEQLAKGAYILKINFIDGQAINKSLRLIKR